MIPYCPICKSNSSNIFSFQRKCYLVDSKTDYRSVTMYGCHKCNIIFVITEDDIEQKIIIDNKMEKVQSILEKISKRCNKVLDNIK